MRILHSRLLRALFRGIVESGKFEFWVVFLFVFLVRVLVRRQRFLPIGEYSIRPRDGNGEGRVSGGGRGEGGRGVGGG